MMINQAELMAPHEQSPYTTEEQYMYDTTEDDKSTTYFNLQNTTLGTDHVPPSLHHELDMGPQRGIPYEGDIFPADVLDLEADRWQSLPIQHWQPCDIISWLFAWANQNQVELLDDEININAFNNLTGEQLCRMNLDQFRAFASHHGLKLYEEVQRHLGTMGPPQQTDLSLISDAYLTDPDRYTSCIRFPDCLENQNSSPCSENESDSASTSSSMSTVNERPGDFLPYMPHDTRILYGKQQMPPPFPVSSKKKGRRGRPPTKETKVRSRSGKGMGKLWEFIRDLLLSPNTNPSLIRWERREDGIFKFVQSDKVAKMWGDRKQNPRMTYEKLSRAMRTYYDKKILVQVPKDKGLPKKLVYKFGPRASGWCSP